LIGLLPVARSTTESAICKKSRFSFAGFRFAGFFVFLAMLTKEKPN